MHQFHPVPLLGASSTRISSRELGLRFPLDIGSPPHGLRNVVGAAAGEEGDNDDPPSGGVYRRPGRLSQK